MSRIGRLPIDIPQNVTIQIKAGNDVVVEGPKGSLRQSFSPEMQITVEDGQLHVNRPSDHRHHRMVHGLTRALINNMVIGVSSGFRKSLEVNGTGYRVELQSNKLVLFMGYSHPVEIDPPPGIGFEVEKGGRAFAVAGIDKQVVGEMAARIRAVRPPEPYHGKGIRYAGEVVRSKQGKTGK